jgi:hypothetical protein
MTAIMANTGNSTRPKHKVSNSNASNGTDAIANTRIQLKGTLRSNPLKPRLCCVPQALRWPRHNLQAAISSHPKVRPHLTSKYLRCHFDIGIIVEPLQNTSIVAIV